MIALSLGKPLFKHSSVSASAIARGIASKRVSVGVDRLLVVGSGVAGSATALVAAELYQIPTTLVYAGNAPTDCNSFWAQGGIIYRNYNPDSGDSADSLAADIHRAGAGLCDDGAVRKVSNEGPDRVRQLLLDKSGIFANVPFDRSENGELSLCLEASHAASRILYNADHTGKIITQHITAAVAKHPLITLQGDTIVTDLVVREGVCVGVQTLEGPELASCGVVLCSGGLAGIYQHSTNPPGFNALGTSVGLASRAGVATRDLEYIQFHPTALMMPNEARFLLTEALRGEGAILRNSDGVAFAKAFHEAGELAPRDVVARGVFNESQKSGQVYLDITHREKAWLRRRFPSIQQHLRKRGLDLAEDLLPITPAAHYTCGGITTDLNGCTSLPGLYAAGEAARTGLHGGNRLASTSLLEGIVFGASVADYCGNEDGRAVAEHARVLAETETSTRRRTVKPAESNAEVTGILDHLKRTMWDNVGVVRTPSSLAYALEELGSIRLQADALFESFPSRETAGLRDAAHAGKAVTQAAALNPISAGAHFIAEEDPEDEYEGDFAATP